MIKFHKHKKEYKALKSTTNLKFNDLKFIDIGSIKLKIHRHKIYQLKIHEHKIYQLKIHRHKICQA